MASVGSRELVIVATMYSNAVVPLKKVLFFATTGSDCNKAGLAKTDFVKPELRGNSGFSVSDTGVR